MVDLSERDKLLIIDMYGSKVSLHNISNFFSINIETVKSIVSYKSPRSYKSEQNIENIRNLLEQGMSIKDIASRLNVTPQRVYQIISENNLYPPECHGYGEKYPPQPSTIKSAISVTDDISEIDKRLSCIEMQLEILFDILRDKGKND